MHHVDLEHYRARRTVILPHDEPAAIQMIRKNGIMQEYYESLIDRGMLKMRALVAVMRKLLGFIHAIVRDDRDYAGEYGAPKRRVIKKAA